VILQFVKQLSMLSYSS